ncbi:MAG: hypothetical protein FWC32_09820 [Firmicutes bacterium]|nr:hypothetical protein [Bacillota bacterium]
MNEITSLWQMFTLTGDPRHYLKYKQRESGTARPREKEHVRDETNKS